MNTRTNRCHLSRRDFLGGVGTTIAAGAVCGYAQADDLPGPRRANELHAAQFFETLDDKSVRCALCPRRCRVPDGKRGYCRVRENRGGRYYTHVYGRAAALNLDPIEKKPFFHVYPGSKVFSIGTVGCNIRCKIDLKAFTQSFYGDVCGGVLQPVLDTLKRLSGSGVWYEIVMLLIPTLNDNPEDIKRMAGWITKELGPDVPLHFTRYHPMYKLRNLPPTPSETIVRARETAMQEGCHFVYTGNVPGMEGQDTLCPSCRKPVIKRYGFSITENHIAAGKCRFCGAVVPGVWG